MPENAADIVFEEGRQVVVFNGEGSLTQGPGDADLVFVDRDIGFFP